MEVEDLVQPFKPASQVIAQPSPTRKLKNACVGIAHAFARLVIPIPEMGRRGAVPQGDCTQDATRQHWTGQIILLDQEWDGRHAARDAKCPSSAASSVYSVMFRIWLASELGAMSAL